MGMQAWLALIVFVVAGGCGDSRVGSPGRRRPSGVVVGLAAQGVLAVGLYLAVGLSAPDAGASTRLGRQFASYWGGGPVPAEVGEGKEAFPLSARRRRLRRRTSAGGRAGDELGLARPPHHGVGRPVSLFCSRPSGPHGLDGGPVPAGTVLVGVLVARVDHVVADGGVPPTPLRALAELDHARATSRSSCRDPGRPAVVPGHGSDHPRGRRHGVLRPDAPDEPRSSHAWGSPRWRCSSSSPDWPRSSSATPHVSDIEAVSAPTSTKPPTPGSLSTGRRRGEALRGGARLVDSVLRVALRSVPVGMVIPRCAVRAGCRGLAHRVSPGWLVDGLQPPLRAAPDPPARPGAERRADGHQRQLRDHAAPAGADLSSAPPGRGRRLGSWSSGVCSRAVVRGQSVVCQPVPPQHVLHLVSRHQRGEVLLVELLGPPRHVHPGTRAFLRACRT